MLPQKILMVAYIPRGQHSVRRGAPSCPPNEALHVSASSWRSSRNEEERAFFIALAVADECDTDLCQNETLMIIAAATCGNVNEFLNWLING